MDLTEDVNNKNHGIENEKTKKRLSFFSEMSYYKEDDEVKFYSWIDRKSTQPIRSRCSSVLKNENSNDFEKRLEAKMIQSKLAIEREINNFIESHSEEFGYAEDTKNNYLTKVLESEATVNSITKLFPNFMKRKYEFKELIQMNDYQILKNFNNYFASKKKQFNTAIKPLKKVLDKFIEKSLQKRIEKLLKGKMGEAVL